MDRLDINTERLITAANMLDIANSEVGDALTILQSITTHNDWHCKERGQINAQIQQNKKQIQDLSEHMTTFTRVTKTVADSFVEKEKNISKLFENLDEVIGKVLNTSDNTPVGITDIVTNLTKKTWNHNTPWRVLSNIASLVRTNPVAYTRTKKLGKTLTSGLKVTGLKNLSL